jgi:hypothetical protein
MKGNVHGISYVLNLSKSSGFCFSVKEELSHGYSQTNIRLVHMRAVMKNLNVNVNAIFNPIHLPELELTRLKSVAAAIGQSSNSKSFLASYLPVR